MELRVVAYADHDTHPPFLIRRLGPFTDPGDLADAVLALGGQGSATNEEALEDAVQRAAELVADVGPHDVLVLADAPPHPPADCPYGIGFIDEVRALAVAGARLMVADDWLDDDQTWQLLQSEAGVVIGPLAELASMVSQAPGERAGRGWPGG